MRCAVEGIVKRGPLALPFDVVAQAFGIPSFRVTQDHEIEDAVQRIFAHKGPLLVHVPINPQENVWPLVPPGKSNEHMMEAAR